jgi:hypothetical protein
MGFISLLNLEGSNILGFFLASLLGFLAGTLVPEGAWATYTSILVSYHVFLAWLIVIDDQKTGVSLPIASTAMTHVACLVLVLPLGMARHFIPFFSFFRYTIAALALFERAWLFNGESKQHTHQAAPATTPVPVDTAEDYQDWLRHLARQKPSSRKPGSSLKTEYEQWILARAKNRPTVSANDRDSGAR